MKGKILVLEVERTSKCILHSQTMTSSFLYTRRGKLTHQCPLQRNSLRFLVINLEADLECCKHTCRRAKQQFLLDKFYKIITSNSPSQMLQRSLDPPLSMLYKMTSIHCAGKTSRMKTKNLFYFLLYRKTTYRLP